MKTMEEWLLATDQVVQVLDLTEISDHTTLQRTYNKLRMKHFDQMLVLLLNAVGVQGETSIAKVWLLCEAQMRLGAAGG